MRWLNLTQPMAALCLGSALVVACNAEPQSTSQVKATAQALSLAADGGVTVPELVVEPQRCTPDGGSPEAMPDFSTLETFPEGSGIGGEQTLEDYTAECERIIGFTLPEEMNCDLGDKVDGQEMSCDSENVWGCDNPNVLGGSCDPGSRFTRLELQPNDNANAAAVLHCRKHGLEDGYYGDIAIIMANKENGATCFFQALGHLEGTKIPSPKKGVRAWNWKSPQATADIGCTSCHDNGSFIRSRYIAQMPRMPNTNEGWGNDGKVPVRWVGKAYADKHSWSVRLDSPPCLGESEGENCLSCTSCHVLAVNDYFGKNSGYSGGTALDFGLRATARYQASKHVHSATSPIWMYPGQTVFEQKSHDAARAYASCAQEFVNNRFELSAPRSPGCNIEPFGGPWTD